jgi:L-fuconolactonase
VLDHLAKPIIRDGTLSPWREQIRELAQAPNVMCKVSGLVTEARWDAWRAEDFRSYLETVLEAFGPARLMYGSDWPVALLAASYEQFFGLAHDYFAPLGDEAQAGIFGGNAVRFYNL